MSGEQGAGGGEVTACLIIIGNESLSGRTQDANLAFLAERLGEWGIRLREARVVPDEEGEIIAAVNQCRAKYDYVFTTGGIGPTHDDITAEAIAKAFGRELIRHPEAEAILRGHYKKDDLNEARMKMANTPEGASLIENPVSRAPGFQVENVFVMAGIPSIMQAMVLSLRHKLVGGRPVLSRAIGCNLVEGALADGLGRLQERYRDFDIGSYPFYRLGRFGVSVVLRGTDADRLEAATGEVRDLIDGLGGEWVEDTEA